MGKSKSFRLEAAGWGFLGVTVLILLGPCIYFAFQITADHYSWNVPAGIGLVFAVILGAIITFIANTII
ncbi:MAG TPA: hypothetical protein PLJ47_14040, partial [Candidatus Hydrogenedentes bacterium]|nr:hypothetical protein [Candidatus Hydrogenedentota bacterium]